MQKLRSVNAHCLEGDSGWKLRDTYNALTNDLEMFETSVTNAWQNRISSKLTECLKQPLLVCYGATHVYV